MVTSRFAFTVNMSPLDEFTASCRVRAWNSLVAGFPLVDVVVVDVVVVVVDVVVVDTAVVVAAVEEVGPYESNEKSTG